jgi:hypothetical protein
MADAQPVLTRPVIIAGLLGGLLGGVAAFAVGRVVVPAPSGKSDAANPAADVRPLAESFLRRLQGDNLDELQIALQNGFWPITQQEYATFRGQFAADRARFVREFGDRTGEFELVRETTLSPSLVKFVYLEKYQRDGILWHLVLYHSQGDWRLIGVSWKEKLAVAVGVLD